MKNDYGVALTYLEQANPLGIDLDDSCTVHGNEVSTRYWPTANHK